MIGFYNYTIILTYMSVISAVFGISAAMSGNPTASIICLMFSGLCDMFDGPVARRRKRTDQEKKFGIQLDSLADVICFGVLPAVIGYASGANYGGYVFVLAAFVITALTRLAYFNVMEEERQGQTTERRKYYEGLPVTSVALIIPVIYGFNGILKDRFPMVYCATLVCLSLAFLVKIKVKKIGPVGMLILIGLGLAELIWVLA